VRKTNSNTAGITEKYANFGLRVFCFRGNPENQGLGNTDVLRALNLVKLSGNAVFVSEPKSVGEELAGRLLLLLKDTPESVIFHLDIGALIEADVKEAEFTFQNIIQDFQDSQRRIILFVTGLTKALKHKGVVSVFCDIVTQKLVPIISFIDINEFRALEELPELSGFLQFVLSGKPGILPPRNKTVLIVGASSLFGSAVYSLFAREYKEVRGTGFNKASRMNFDRLDVTSEEEIKAYFSKHSAFDTIIYIAGEANADIAEKERERTHILNVDAVSTIAKYAKDSKFVYISSEYVFDGSSGPYGSGSAAKPINYYGYTKLEGEKVSLKNFPDSLIVRLGALYGYNGPLDKETTVSKLISSLSKPEPLKADNVQIKHPVLLEDAANLLLKLLDYNAKGVYQINGPEGLNKQEMAERIAKVKEGMNGDKFSYPIIGTEQTAAAAKPLNTHMVNIDTPRSFEEGIVFMLKRQQENKHEH
jgi:dTDP-4-dehydrorhamnose reductase